jgi:hypothetical protein
MTKCYCLRFETPSTWRARSPCLYPQEQGDPVISSGTGFPYCRLLRLAGSRWRYSTPPPHGLHYQTFPFFFYNHFALTEQKTSFPKIPLLFRIRCRGNLLTEPLPSSGPLLWFHYSRLQASCHNINESEKTWKEREVA